LKFELCQLNTYLSRLGWEQNVESPKKNFL
jgi:hypothetical protein